jgi:uncharacterized protein YbbC (DUF1343 family)/CubicO group peptidase (beta-lactamase class C family)
LNKLIAACAIAMLIALAPGARAQTRTLSAAQLQPIGAIVSREIRAGRIPGAVVVIGSRERIIYTGAFGERALTPVRLPMTADTIFDLASLTKVVATTTAILQLQEQKKIALDDPIAKYWPAFAANGKESITIREALTHYSGLPPDLDGSGWTGYDTAMRRIAALRPRATPGTRYIYSDVNFEALGEIVRRVSGEPLDAYCSRHIFAPLGMRDTGFRPPLSRRSRIAPTEFIDGKLRWGQVHDPTAFRMGGVSGDAGLFSTAGDLARFAQMILGGGSLDGVRVISAESIGEIEQPQSPAGEAKLRSIGWDIAAPLSSNRAHLAPAGSFGHLGYTGTMLWIDPLSQTWVIVLTNRVHPHGHGDAQPLRKEVLALVSDALGPASEDAVLAAMPRLRDYRIAAAPAVQRVATGADVMAADGFAALRGLRVGLITNHTGRDSSGARTIDLMRKAPGVKLAALFSPEHGLYGNVDRKVGSMVDPASGLPVFSLYGSMLRPSDAMLDGIEAMVFDVQDAGTRFYTYATTMAYAMKAAARDGIDFYVLDRPDPITAEMVQGPVLDRDLESFAGYFPAPVRHGMTMGEMARMFNAENRIGAKLHVIAMRGYQRGDWFDQTGLRWVPPSPNLRTLDQATLYPGVAMVESANVSVGRGTQHPFEVVGAPWIDGRVLAGYLNRRAIAGVRFSAADFVPASDAYRNRECHGVRISLEDRQALDSARLGIEIASALHRLYPGFELDRTLGMIGSRSVLSAIKGGDDPAAVESGWQGKLAVFRATRAKYLLY